MKEVFSKVCLSSEGNGRLSAQKSRNIFSYESLNEVEDKQWSLAVELPLHGEEVLVLNWADAANEQVSMEGEFYSRILAQLHNSPKLKSLMKVFLLKTGQIINAQSMMQKDEANFVCQQTEFDAYKEIRSGQCTQKGSKFSFDWKLSEKEFEITISIADSYIYSIKFFNSKDTYYGNVDASLIRVKTKAKLFSLKLFLSTCTASPA